MTRGQTQQDLLGVIGSAALIGTSMSHSLEFHEALLRDEDTFMFYNFPINSDPTDEEVIRRFEEILIEAATEASLIGKLNRLIQDQAGKL